MPSPLTLGLLGLAHAELERSRHSAGARLDAALGTWRELDSDLRAIAVKQPMFWADAADAERDALLGRALARELRAVAGPRLKSLSAQLVVTYEHERPRLLRVANALDLLLATAGPAPKKRLSAQLEEASAAARACVHPRVLAASLGLDRLDHHLRESGDSDPTERLTRALGQDWPDEATASTLLGQLVERAWAILADAVDVHLIEGGAA